jgi:thiol-disulfide isomerase/thioredoxin
LTSCQEKKGEGNVTEIFEKSLKEQKKEGTLPEYIEHFDSKTLVTFFYMDGCPHCVDFEPEWTKFVANPPPNVSTEKHESKEKITKARKDIQGYPTIIITKDGKDTIYPGERTASDLSKYVSGLK